MDEIHVRVVPLTQPGAQREMQFRLAQSRRDRSRLGGESRIIDRIWQNTFKFKRFKKNRRDLVSTMARNRGMIPDDVAISIIHKQNIREVLGKDSLFERRRHSELLE